MGSGYRVFTAGEVLTASNVQNYLQDQAVMVFGGTAARSSAIGTANFEEGMLTYLTDVDKLQVYTGAAFADVYPPTASSQGLTLISTTSFSAVASQSVNNVFSSTYTNYRINLDNITYSQSTDTVLRLRASGVDTTTNYIGAGVYLDHSVSTVNGQIVSSMFLGNSSGTNGKVYGYIDIYNPNVAIETSASYFKPYRFSTGSSGAYTHGLAFFQTGSTQFDGFTIVAGAGTISGSVSVYGYNK